VTEQLTCVVRGCVALTSDPKFPLFCTAHRAMTAKQRHEWSREHGFNTPHLRNITDRIEYERA
jgi:hypothetical protein